MKDRKSLLNVNYLLRRGQMYHQAAVITRWWKAGREQSWLFRERRMKSLLILVVQLSIISGECPHPNFVENHVCQYCRDWKEVGGGRRWKEVEGVLMCWLGRYWSTRCLQEPRGWLQCWDLLSTPSLLSSDRPDQPASNNNQMVLLQWQAILRLRFLRLSAQCRL